MRGYALSSPNVYHNTQSSGSVRLVTTQTQSHLSITCSRVRLPTSYGCSVRTIHTNQSRTLPNSRSRLSPIVYKLDAPVTQWARALARIVCGRLFYFGVNILNGEKNRAIGRDLYCSSLLSTPATSGNSVWHSHSDVPLVPSLFRAVTSKQLLTAAQ